MKPYLIHAEWDDKAKVWVATSNDVPSLATEADTQERLVAKLKTLIPELLQANGIDAGADVPFELLMRRFEGVSSPVQPTTRFRFLTRIKVPVMIMIIVGLVIANVLSLIDDAFHSTAYGVVGGILGAGAVLMAADLLKNSPTVNRRSDVKKATGAIEAEKKAILAAKAGVEAKHAALEKSHKVIEAEKAAVTKARDELQEKTARRAAATSNFANKVSARTVKNVSRNVSGMAAEALPYVGIGVMVGITALDIKDACDTLKDMNELKAAFELPKEDESVVCGMKVPTVQDVLTSIKTNGQAAYKTAAESINQAGGAIMSVQVPSVSWGQIRDLSSVVVGGAGR